MNHTDAGVQEPSLGPADGGTAHFFLQLRAFCPRQNCGAFYGYTPRQDYEVAGLLALFSNKLRFFRLPQHLAHDDGTLQSGGDFRVASAQGNAERPAGVEYIQENLLRQLRSGTAFRQQQRCQEPTRLCAQRGDVVGVDMDGVPADALLGEGDGVGLGDKVFRPDVNDRGIFPVARANHHAGGRGRVALAQEALEHGGRQFAYGQRRSECASSCEYSAYRRCQATFLRRPDSSRAYIKRLQSGDV